MLEACVNQAAGLQGIALQAAPRVMAMASHGQQLGEGAERYSWVGYISSTSVYGDHKGDWVDER